MRKIIGKWTLYITLTASKVVTEMKRYDRFKICRKNGNKWYIRNIQIKDKIKSIFQYRKPKDVAFVVQYLQIIIKSILITQPLSFYLKKALFSAYSLRPLKRVNNVMMIIELRLSVEILSSPHLRILQSLTLTGYSDWLT